MDVTPGYKQTEVGVIPEDWDVESIGDAFEIRNNLRLPISQTLREKMSGQYPYYGPTGTQGYINEYRVEGEHALIGEDGDHFLKWRDQSMTLLVSGQFNVNNHAHLIRGTKNLTSWFYHYFSHRDLTRYLTRQGAGRYKLTKTTLLNIPCALPSTKAEQEAIAEALSDADAFIESLEQLIAKKRGIKEGAMQELLAGKRRLPGFSGEWGVKPLGELAEIDPDNLGSSTSGDYTFNYISLEDVDVGTLRNYTEQRFSSAPSRARRRLKQGDILVSTVRPNLQSHLLFSLSDPDWICSTGFSIVRCRKQDANPAYVYSHLFGYSVVSQIQALIAGSNYPAINRQDVKAIEIPIPTLPEQTAIATVLSDMDSEVAALEEKLAKARQVKQGMMHNLLTGRIRLI